MSNPVIAFLMAISVGTWVYSKMYKRTLGNQQVSITVGGVVGLVLLLVAWTLLNMIFSS